MLALLEEEQLVRGTGAGAGQPTDRAAARAGVSGSREQLGLFAQPNPIVDQLAGLDVNSMTPLDALSRLAAFVEDAKRSR
jgi:hypothetical protein